MQVNLTFSGHTIILNLMSQKATLCCLKTWWKWAIGVLLEWETITHLYFIMQAVPQAVPVLTNPLFMISEFVPFILWLLQHICLGAPHISLHIRLWGPLYSHHDLHLSQCNTNGIQKTTPISNTLSFFPCPVTIDWEESSICCGLFQAPTGQSSSWSNSTYKFWKFRVLYTLPTYLTIVFQEAFGNKSIQVSA